MSSINLPPSYRGNTSDQHSTVQKLLDENSRLIDIITEYQNQKRADDAIKHQNLLHRNLLHLANLADPSLLQLLREEVLDIHQPHQHQQQHPLHAQPHVMSNMQQGSFAPPPMSNQGTHELMPQYQAQMRHPGSGYPTFGQPAPQMAPQGRMPPGYPYPQQMQGYPPQGYENQPIHPGYPAQGQPTPQQQSQIPGQPNQHFMR